MKMRCGVQAYQKTSTVANIKISLHKALNDKGNM